MNTIYDIELNEEDLNNSKYNYQIELTSKLDDLQNDFTQEIINEIVLWKINRYSKPSNETLDLLNKITKNDDKLDEELTRQVLKELLQTKGMKLAMASTVLRFKNPKVYQIIDQRVYRFIYPNEDLTKITSNIDKQIQIYLKYLSDLKEICISKNIDFTLSDRILYSLDKEYNKDFKIKA